MNLQFIRRLSTKKIAVIGSGPSAFYTVLNLLKLNKNYEIDMFEKNPCPFGLVRFGIAPDHPEVKSCSVRFKDAFGDEVKDRFKFFGNVLISDENSKSLSLKNLYENYNCILFAYGSTKANNLNFIEKLNLPQNLVIDSKKFVGWYNGDPNFKNLNPPLDKIEDVTIIGNGNVSIDIVRVLLAPIEHWLKTDITETSLDILKKSTIKRVNVVARKGVLESKFTNKEFRELLELDKVGVMFAGWPKEKFSKIVNGDIKKLNRIEKRRISLITKYDEKFTKVELDKGKSWRLDYLKSPIGFKVSNDGKFLEETIFKEHELKYKNDSGDEITNYKIEPSGKISSLKNQLVILATGYKGEPLIEFEEFKIPFDKERGLIPNENGKVKGVSNSYCVGWIANGSQGNINSTVISSNDVANVMDADLQDEKINGEEKQGRVKIQEILKNKDIKVVDWNDWLKIEKMEIEDGKKHGKPLEKITDFNKMIEAI